MVLEHTVVRTDKGTLERLKQMAGDKSVPQYLRDLAHGVEQEPVPVNELETLRGSILKRLDKIEERFDKLEKWMELLYDIAGGLVSDRDRHEVILFEYAKKNPEFREVIMRLDPDGYTGHVEAQKEFAECPEYLMEADDEFIEKARKEYDLSDSEVEQLRKEFEVDESDEQ